MTQCLLVSFPMAAMTHHHVLMALKQQNSVLSHLEATLPPKGAGGPRRWAVVASLLPQPLPLCLCMSLLLRRTPVIGLGPAPLQHDLTNYIFKDPISKSAHLLRLKVGRKVGGHSSSTPTHDDNLLALWDQQQRIQERKVEVIHHQNKHYGREEGRTRSPSGGSLLPSGTSKVIILAVHAQGER